MYPPMRTAGGLQTFHHHYRTPPPVRLFRNTTTSQTLYDIQLLESKSIREFVLRDQCRLRA